MARIIYIHVPKCGGSSFAPALRLRYLTSQASIALNQGDPRLRGTDAILSDYGARRHELRAHVAAGKRLISGHVQYDPHLHEGAARNYRFVTMLRDPVDRFVSHYHYVQRKHPDPGRAATLEGFLDTPDAQRLASQYLFYFAGHWQGPGINIGALTVRASRHLARFELVGDLSDPDDILRGLRRLTLTPLVHLRRNVAPVPLSVPHKLRPRIEALCAADIAIYESRLAQRHAA